MRKYPKLVINREKLIHNVKTVKSLCAEQQIKVSGVIKGANALEDVIKCFIDGGVTSLASSRTEQLKTVKEIDENLETMMIRIPMLSEVKDIIKYCDISVNSEIKVIEVLNKEAEKQDTIHKIVIMIDLGDLREGYFDIDDTLEAVKKVDKLSNIKLVGVGTNLGCYGSIKPTPENLSKLVEIAHKVEEIIGRKLEIVSGGATSTLTLVDNKTVPEGINHLRVGEGILLNRDLPDYWNCDIDGLYNDVFILQTEVIERKLKPSYPIGEIFIDAFGNKPEYTDEGMRIKALLGVGKQDIGDFDKLIPVSPKVKLIGASSDHLIADVTECENDVEIGSILEFKLAYQAMLFLTESPYVTKELK